MCKTHAMKVSYLLGVEESVLIRDYHDDYIDSGNLLKLKCYDSVEIVRALQRIRQGLLRYHPRYKSIVNLSNISDGHFDNELDILESKGIELPVSNVTEIINYLTDNIFKFLDVALGTLNIPYKDKMKELFRVPHFPNKKAMMLYSDDVSKSNAPHGILISKHYVLKTGLPFTLTNDRNLFCAVHTLAEESYECNELIEAEGRSWGNDTEVDDKMSILEVMSSSGKDTKIKVYVDCDNTDFFKFVSFINKIKDIKENVKEIILYIDPKANPLWSLINTVMDINFTTKTLERLKDSKSIADLVISSDITKDILKREVNSILLISSDSDFFILMKEFTVCDFVVGYDNCCTSQDYLKFLVNNKIKTLDIAQYESVNLLNKYKRKFISYLILKSLSMTSLGNWDINITISSVLNVFNRETSFEITEKEIECVFEDMKENIKITFVNNKIQLECGDIIVKP